MGRHEATADQNGRFGDDIDALLVAAGQRLLPSDLRRVAQRLEQLESSVLAGSASSECPRWQLQLARLQPLLFPPDATGDDSPDELAARLDRVLGLCHSSPPRRNTAWATVERALEAYGHARPLHAATLTRAEEVEVQQVHFMLACAEAMQQGESWLATSLMEQMPSTLWPGVTSSGAVVGVVRCFGGALLTRLFVSPRTDAGMDDDDDGLLYRQFYEVCPYLKVAHAAANQAILEAFDGHDRVHVVDLNLAQGLQWPALIQALAIRPGGPPSSLRLTGVGPPSVDGKDRLGEVGRRLAELARSAGVPFAFQGIPARSLEEVRPWMLQVSPREEAVAVNSVMVLHRLVGDPEAGEAPAMEAVLGWVRRVRPEVVTVVEQEADHNGATFMERFTEALRYYSCLLDSVEGGQRQLRHQRQQEDEEDEDEEEKRVVFEVMKAEVYLRREIENIVCCEGEARVERHEPLARWRGRMGRAGFGSVRLGAHALYLASALLALSFPGDGYSVEEVDGCLTLGWHGRPLLSASAWKPDCTMDEHNVSPSPVIPDEAAAAAAAATLEGDLLSFKWQ